MSIEKTATIKVTVIIKVGIKKTNVPVGLILEHAANEMDYSFSHEDEDCKILNTEIIDVEHEYI